MSDLTPRAALREALDFIDQHSTPVPNVLVRARWEAALDAHQCLPSRGRIRIRTPDDKPGHWTAHGDLVPGVPYTYWSGDVAVGVDWKGAHQCLPSDPEDRWRLVRISTDLLSQFGTRTEDGRAITAEWGEPDADGIYEPVFTVSGDAHRCLPSEGAVPTDVVDISSQCLPSEEELAALITESTTKLLNDRATIGYRDDIRPYIRLRNYLLAILRERRG